MRDGVGGEDQTSFAPKRKFSSLLKVGASARRERQRPSSLGAGATVTFLTNPECQAEADEKLA